MPLVTPRPPRSPYPPIIAGALVVLVVAIIAVGEWEEDRRKYEYRGGPIGDLRRINEPYYHLSVRLPSRPSHVPSMLTENGYGRIVVLGRIRFIYSVLNRLRLLEQTIKFL